MTSPSQKDPRPYVKWPQRPARGAGGSRGSLGPPALGDAAPARAGAKGSAVGTCPRPPRTVTSLLPQCHCISRLNKSDFLQFPF